MNTYILDSRRGQRVLITLLLVISTFFPWPSTAAQTKAIIPLYVDLERDPKAWDPLFKVIEAHQAVLFEIIINPDDGPGKKDLPNDDWSKGVERLKRSRNVQLLGYVKIGYARRNLATVKGEISRYARWANKKTSIAVDGIFLDEAPYTWNETTSRYLEDVQRAIKEAPGLGRRSITINPGLPPDNKFFTIFDTVCVIEANYSFWLTEDCKKRLASISAPPDRRCIILHSAGALSRDGYRGLVRELEGKAEYIYLTDLDKDYYGKFGRKYPLSAFIGDIDGK